MTGDAPHVPVLLAEVLDALAIVPGETHVDGTFGAGGYSRAMAGAGASVFAIDRDPDAIAEGAAVVQASGGKITLVHGAYADMAELLHAAGIGQVDGVVLDIGVSSMQIDRASRGFSFQSDGPLDMRMSQSGLSAAEWLNSAAEEEIADVLWRYGEERQSRRIARAIVAARPLSRTGELATIVRRALGHRPGEPKDPATRAFQAIRIFINRELDELEAGLRAAEAMLAPGGRLAVVTFHSLEDRIVKQFLRDASGAMAATSRHLPQAAPSAAPTFTRLSKAIRPSDAEITRNPRARSATLRAATRTEAAARDRRNAA
jgi:16S rRNA (cytosine1402-N4)-methyltransferase